MGNPPKSNMGVQNDYFRHSQSSKSEIGLTMSPKVLPLPAMEVGGRRLVLTSIMMPISSIQ